MKKVIECRHYFKGGDPGSDDCLNQRYTCEICGEVRQMPKDDTIKSKSKFKVLTPGKQIDVWDKQRFYLAHKSDILRDVEMFGRKKVMKIYGIPSNSLVQVLQRWSGTGKKSEQSVNNSVGVRHAVPPASTQKKKNVDAGLAPTLDQVKVVEVKILLPSSVIEFLKSVLKFQVIEVEK